MFNIGGLTTAFAAFILISLYVRYETTWDRFNQGYEQIYRVELEMRLSGENTFQHIPQAPWPAGRKLKEEYSEVTDYAVLRDTWGQYLSKSDGMEPVYEEKGYYANNQIFDVFSLEFIHGSPARALSEPNTMVVTQKLAEKYFPGENPVGKTLVVDKKYTCRVTGIIKDPPSNFHLDPDYFISAQSFEERAGYALDSKWSDMSSRVYVVLHPDADVQGFRKKIKDLLYTHSSGSRLNSTRLVNLADIHLKSTNNGGLMGIVYLFATAGLAILLLGAINFTNLTTAYMSTRYKEVGLKKVMGSKRFRIIRGILGESVLITLTALVLAFTIAELALPTFNQVVSKELTIRYTENWLFIAFLVGIALLLGMASSLYPALKFSRLRPVEALKGQKQSKNKPHKLRLNRILTTFQLLISISFVLYALRTYELVQHFTEMDMGFNEEDLMLCETDGQGKAETGQWEVLQSEILASPHIQKAAISTTAPFHDSHGRFVNWEGSMADEKLMFQLNNVGKDFIDTYGIKLIKGRNFSDQADPNNQECLINEMVVKKTGWKNPIGKTLDDGKLRVIGVIRDYHRMTPTIEIMPQILLCHSGQLNQTNMISMRVKPASTATARKEIKRILNSYLPGAIVDPQMMEDAIASEMTVKIYRSIGDSVAFFAVVSIIIAVVGLFAMVSFSSRQRTKEVGIRKVMGASSMMIYREMIGTYLKFYIIASLLAVAATLYLGDSDPAYYRPEENPWIFILTLAGALMVILLTISVQILQTARTNPADSLRDE